MTVNTPAPAPKDAVLTTGQILSLERRSNMTDDEALRFARAIESALLSKLRAPVAVDLVHRLRCKYAMGPMIDGEPEFGWRDYSGPAPEGMRLPSPIMLDAAAAIERLAAQLREGAETLGADQIDYHRAMRAYEDSTKLRDEMPHKCGTTGGDVSLKEQ